MNAGQTLRERIEEAKSRLPLPQLLAKIGDGDHAKKSARCPFHEDNHASFSMFQKDGAWFWKCHAGCGHGDGVDYLERRFGLSTKDAIARYCQEAGLWNAAAKTSAKRAEPFDWPQCVAAFTPEARRKLADWRGYSPAFVDWMHGEQVAGIHEDKIAFAVHKVGQVIGCHYLADRSKRLWKYYPTGNGTQPLVFGDPARAGYVIACESQWDAFSIMEKLGWHLKPPADTAVLVTRGSENGKLIAGRCSPDAVVYGFIQNDTPKSDGTIPAEKWLTDIAAHAGCKVLRVTTPAPHKDANDWTQGGATRMDIEAAINVAKLVDVRPRLATATSPDSTPDIPIPSEHRSDTELPSCYGQPLFYSPNGALAGINERFFAGDFNRSGNILFEPAERAFYDYSPDTGLWQRQCEEHIREQVSARVLEYGRKNSFNLESKITTAKMGAVMGALRGIAERRDAFTHRGDYVHVANGVIRFGNDGRVILSEFRSDDYSRNRCPFEFSGDAECPRFLNELLRPALPDDDVDLFQRWAGLALAGVNPAQRFVILDGNSNTGKTQLAALMRKIVGQENCAQLRTALLLERFEIFRFVGTTLLLAPDVQGDFLSQRAASVLKALVGGDPLTAEAKGSNQRFSLIGNFNVLITSNSRLRLRLDGDAGAWRRRLILIRFENSPPKVRIPNFADKLAGEEGPGILRWALAGLLRARQEIAETGDLHLSAEQQARIDALLSESDSLRQFIRECSERGKSDVTTSEFVEGYFRFCADRDWTPQPAKTVERNLKDIMLETYGLSQCHDIKRGGKPARGWSGVRLKASAPVVHKTSPELPVAYAEH